MTEVSRAGVVIVAAGSSKRMGGIDKVFAPLGGKPLLAWSVDTCQQCDLVQQVIIVLSQNNLKEGQKLMRERGWSKSAICPGGMRRQDSVREGLRRVKGCEWVVIHDGARPFLTMDLIRRGLEAASETGSAAAAVPVKDTVKLAGDGGLVTQTIQRDKLWAVQTPQIFGFDIIDRAYGELATEVTDDATAVERSGCKVKLYVGAYTNLKVTTPEDMVVAEAIAREAPFEEQLSGAMEKGGIRVGIGYDSHPLVPGRKLILAGVDIPYDKGLLGWSDADVVVHAIIDALCGVADLGDIGTQFPPGKPEYKDVSSLILLAKIAGLLRAKGFRVTGIDTIIMAQHPELSPFIPEMRDRVSRAMGIDSAQVTIKSTTTNGLGFIGRGEGIAAQSVALAQKGSM